MRTKFTRATVFLAVAATAALMNGMLTTPAAALAGSVRSAAVATATDPSATVDVSAFSDDEYMAMMAVQYKLDAEAAAVQKTAAASDPSFSNVEVDAVHKTLFVFRSAGTVDASDLYKGVTPPVGTTIQFAPALLSKSQIDNITAGYTKDRQALRSAGIIITGYGLESPGGKFVVRYDPSGLAPTTKNLRSLAAAVDLPSEALDAALTAYVPMTEIPASRMADSSPYYGGDAIHGPLGSPTNPSLQIFCSGGFVVHSAGGGAYLITSWHCWDYYDNNFGTKWCYHCGEIIIGAVTATQPTLDVAFIHITGAGLPIIFSGSNLAQATDNLSVTNSFYLFAGDYVCRSGVKLFNICNSRVGLGHTATPTNDYTGAQASVTSSFLESTNGAAVVAQGDSGGPVYTKLTSSTVQARGIIQGMTTGGGHLVPCETTVNGGSGTCSNQGIIVDAEKLVVTNNVHYN